MISTRTAKALCTKTELELVRQSSARHITQLTDKQLKSKIARSRKLRDKYRDLASRQEREARGKQKAKSTRASQGSGQTRKKQQLFAETLDRYQTRLKKLTTSGKTAKKKPVKKKATKAQVTKKKSKSKAVKKTARKKPVKKSAAAKKPAKPSKSAKKTTKKITAKGSAKKTKLSTRAKKAATAAKKSRVARSGRVRKTAHLSSTTRRNQGKRNKTRN